MRCRSTADYPAAISTSRLEDRLKKANKHTARQEFQMKELEAKLAYALNDFRSVDELLQEARKGLQAYKANYALKTQVPSITQELDNSMATLAELAESLPNIRSQVSDIRKVYDSGRQQARSLVADLTWLNTEFYERWRTTIFTSRSPVSWRWKTVLRIIFVITFIIFSCLAYVTLSGAYRAHRHRLVWGEKLMS
ncbi:hypothetical protein BDQ17DRAFT_1389707 [Cyathus striatus]|nr:hypothetical protein BDQ17DRAFT_1389707 [Cyathus striatus]